VAVNGEDLIARPEGMWLEYMDGTSAAIDSLLYTGQNEDGLFVWEAIDPHPDRMVLRLHYDLLPAYTTVTVQR
jgi:hypothetical protein